MHDPMCVQIKNFQFAHTHTRMSVRVLNPCCQHARVRLPRYSLPWTNLWRFSGPCL